MNLPSLKNERALPAPKHVAIIMDGNGRWAKSHGLPKIAGHQRGAESVKNAVKTLESPPSLGGSPFSYISSMSSGEI